MKQYIKNDVIKEQNKIVIIKNNMQYINPSEELILEDGWVEYVYKQPTETLAELKQRIKNTVIAYDQSEEVNIFYVNNSPIWLDKATRAGLMLRFQAEVAMGKEETSLWYEGVEFPLNISTAMQMLYAIEVYASQCYDNTQKHLAEIDKLTTKKALNAYDYKVGYPEPLRF